MKLVFEEFFRELFLTVVSASCCVCLGVEGEGRLWCAAGVLTQPFSFLLVNGVQSPVMGVVHQGLKITPLQCPYFCLW